MNRPRRQPGSKNKVAVFWRFCPFGPNSRADMNILKDFWGEKRKKERKKEKRGRRKERKKKKKEKEERGFFKHSSTLMEFLDTLRAERSEAHVGPDFLKNFHSSMTSESRAPTLEKMLIIGCLQVNQ